jgi:archaellum component FlaC
MAEEPENTVLVMLRRIDAKLDRIADDVSDLKIRQTATEEAVVGIHRRLDRLEMRVERIEKRLDLVQV